MAQNREPHAFISYVREDSAVVDELEQVLVAAGIPVWRDVKDLFPGDAWRATIKAAIQGDSLAFIPVFSSVSEARERSQMREEIRLAIDEYRKMAPNRPWIFAVRLDDVAVPKYEVSATQDLTDLNWTDFFGPRKTVAVTQLVKRVQELLGEGRAALAEPSAIAASASGATRGAILANAVREAAIDHSRVGDASQMMVEETRRVVDALNDRDRFSLEAPEGSVTRALLQRTQDVSALVAPLVEASVELGAWGKASDAALATQLVSSLAREGFANQLGARFDGFVSLRKLPAVCVLMAGALGATARMNGHMLRAFVVSPQIDLHGHRFPVTAVLSPWDPFGADWYFAQFMIGVLEGGEVTEEVVAAYDNHAPRRTRPAPASSIVSRILQTAGMEFAVGLPEFDELFHRTEVLIGVAANDWVLQQGTGRYGEVENWIGAQTRTEWSSHNPLPERILMELDAAGGDWWPILGGLFGQSYERARAAMQGYVDMAVEARKTRFR